MEDNNGGNKRKLKKLHNKSKTISIQIKKMMERGDREEAVGPEVRTAWA